MSDAVMVPRERLIEIIGGEVCVMADHGDSIDPSSVEDAADAILKAFAASTPVGGWEEQLAGRDAFIVRKGLWSEFVDSLPPPPSVSIDSRPQEAVPTEQAEPAVVARLVDRFLSWRLPEDFNPDGGVRFDKERLHPAHWPSGTNLLDYAQATEMVRRMLAGEAA